MGGPPGAREERYQIATGAWGDTVACSRCLLSLAARGDALDADAGGSAWHGSVLCREVQFEDLRLTNASI